MKRNRRFLKDQANGVKHHARTTVLIHPSSFIPHPSIQAARSLLSLESLIHFVFNDRSVVSVMLRKETLRRNCVPKDYISKGDRVAQSGKKSQRPRKSFEQSRSVWMETAELPLESALTDRITADVCVVGAGIAG